MEEDIESKKSEYLPIELPIHIRVGWPMKVVAWFGILFFGFLATISLNSRQIGPAYCFLGFIGLNIAVLITTRSSIQVDETAIKVTVPYGTYRIEWAEVQEIKSSGASIAFEGNNKRVVISATFGTGRVSDLFRYIWMQSKLRGIPVIKTNFPSTHKNARIGF